MLNIGIILPDLGQNQLAFLAINQANNLSRRVDLNVILFYRNSAPPYIPSRVSVMNISELQDFQGTLISTDIDGTMTSLNLVSNVKRIFYVWDLEWIRKPHDFLTTVKAYRDPRVELVCRGNAHAIAVKNYSNRDVKVVPNLNIEALLQ